MGRKRVQKVWHGDFVHELRGKTPPELQCMWRYALHFRSIGNIYAAYVFASVFFDILRSLYQFMYILVPYLTLRSSRM